MTGSSLRGRTSRWIARQGVPRRAILLGCAIAAMALALYGGLSRLGLPLPSATPLEDVHGPLMICGVFGTLISLERAVAIGLNWPYAAPAFFVISAVAMVSGLGGLAAASAVGGAGVFLLASIWIATKQRALFTGVLALAAAMLLGGCVLWWSGLAIPAVAGWWLSFLVLTIVAERLELSRVMQPTRLAQLLFVGAMVLAVGGAALGLEAELGRGLLGAGLFAMAAWLVGHDVAMRTVRLAGMPRFMASAMLAGYFWLAVTGAFLVGGWAGPFGYDLSLHAILIGFVLSMVFGHALIIFPAITGVTLRYWPPLYVPLAMLHLSVALRVVGGLLEIEPLRLASGPLTVLALLSFGVLVAVGRTR